VTRVRYFAAAEEAAGREEEVRSEATLGELRDALAADHPRLGAILARCSILVDGVRTSDPRARIDGAETVDVLPPFAGG